MGRWLDLNFLKKTDRRDYFWRETNKEWGDKISNYMILRVVENKSYYIHNLLNFPKCSMYIKIVNP